MDYGSDQLLYEHAMSRFRHEGRPRRRQPILIVGSMIVALMAAALGAAYGLAASPYQPTSTSALKLCGPPDRTTRLPPGDRPLIFRDPYSQGVRAVAFCRDSRFLAAADGNGHAYVWSLTTHKVVAVLGDPHSRGVNAVDYRPRTKILATGDANGHVYLWQPGVKRPHVLTDPASKGVRAIAFSPNGQLLAAADANGRSYVWSLATHRIVATLRVSGSKGVNAVAFRGNGESVAAGDANGVTYLWAVPKKLGTRFRARLEARFRDPRNRGVRAVAFRPRRGGVLATADADGHLYLWRLGVVRPRILADPRSKGIDGEAFSPNGEFLPAADADGRLYFWMLPLDKIVEFLTRGGVRAVAFSPDSRRLATGDADGRIYVSDVTHIGIQAAISGR
jgi:WD40 repeat protein